MKLLEEKLPIRGIVCMLQKEVAHRIQRVLERRIMVPYQLPFNITRRQKLS